ncbi:MAG TPA: MerR family transcriptional regulator [Solirubrobacteraceae bacterium]|nr:MerR family transcriptional regulator [Solirubrobacteraceae bacterium]
MAEAAEAMTIDELARATGMTVRNIRAHQSRGLLPPPEVRARTGYYGPEHVARLRLIQELQGDGYNLAAIKHLLSRADGSAEAAHILGFTRTLLAPHEAERPEVIDAAELAERFGREGAARALARAERLGILLPLGEGRYEVPSPTVLRAGEALRELGMPLDKVLDIAERVTKDADGASHTFVRLFVDRVWRPFDEAGRPAEDWPRVQETLEHLRPLLTDGFQAIFRRRMSHGIEAAFGRELEKRAKG